MTAIKPFPDAIVGELPSPDSSIARPLSLGSDERIQTCSFPDRLSSQATQTTPNLDRTPRADRAEQASGAA